VSAARLAAHLRECNLSCAAVIVERGLTDAVQAVRNDLTLSDLSHLHREVTEGLMDLWVGGHADVIGDVLDAWERNGCERCALAVIRGTDHAGRCPSCVEDGR
jgi:hypothetical protein